ncbi:TonB-dependent receptor plug domain-containing protein [Oligella urethralis]|uniref:TonB-dependent receptor plug domain-containing protein n=1 Tax=Oligella urethralis TaxID=90245 RepID=UPI000660DD56|nr:TonB-dependent receptor [Oligella urethralis]
MFKVSSLTTALAVAYVFTSTATAQSTDTQHTQPEIQPLPPLVVIASRSAQTIDRAIGDISVIDGVQLRQSTDATILRTLARQPGIQMYDSGGPQTTSGISMRGAWGDQNLIMLNGIRINNPVSGNSIPWGTLNPRAFERVEMVRGSASSLWGSSAMGGVVNLVTEVAPGEIRDFSPYADIGFGSQGTARSGAGFSGADGTFDYSLNALYARSDGYNATTKDNVFSYHPDDDGYQQHSLSGSFGWTWAPEQRIGVHFFNSYLNGDYDAGQFDPVGAHVKQRQQVYGVSNSNKITDWWQSTLRYGFVKTSMFNNGPFGDSNNRNYQNSFSWQHDFSLTPDQIISVFYEGYKERIASSSQFDKNKRNINSFGAIYQGHFMDRHHVQASIRNDRYTDYGARTTGSLAYDLDITEEVTVGVAANTGFRMPSFYDLYAPLEWGFKGNPELKPEKSRNFEAHISFENETSSASLRAFHSKYRDLINPYDLSMSPASTSNTEKASIRGISLNASHDFGTTLIYAGADFLDHKDDSTKKRLLRRARQVYRAGVVQRYERFELGAEFMHIGSRFDDKDNTPEKRLGGYGIVNLSAKAQLSKEFSAQLHWNNVFDKKYAPSHGYRGQGSNVFVNLSWQPKQ